MSDMDYNVTEKKLHSIS